VQGKLAGLQCFCGSAVRSILLSERMLGNESFSVSSCGLYPMVEHLQLRGNCSCRFVLAFAVNQNFINFSRFLNSKVDPSRFNYER
jgi:hypothetical protein